MSPLRTGAEILADFERATIAELARTHAQLAETEARAPVSVYLLRNTTLEHATPTLELAGHARGVPLRYAMCDFDAYRASALRPSPELQSAPIVVVLLWLEDLPAYDVRSATLDAEAAFEELWATVDATLANTSACVMVATFVPPVGVSHASATHDAVEILNGRIRAAVAGDPRLVVLDLAREVQSLGDRAVDARQHERTAAPIAEPLIRRIGLRIASVAAALSGKSKKVMVVDADETLWGGVLGEDGLDGIRLDPRGPGRAHLIFQRQLRELRERGVLLALASKNDADLVHQVLREHPTMLLREEDFVLVEASWRPKSESIERMAERLNLGLDAFVFVDDSPAERAEVSRALPAVEVLAMPRHPGEIIQLLPRYVGFSPLRTTQEDAQRTALYRADAQRATEREQHARREDYLRSLGLRVEIGRAAEGELERLAQLTQRTNQFNATTRRRDVSELRRLAGAGAELLSVTVHDRFGSYGLTGLAILREQGDGVEIDTFLLSCRVLGRDVELALLAECAAVARRLGRPLIAKYLPTSKNRQVADFFPTNGFVSQADGETFVLTTNHRLECPAHITMERRQWKRSTPAFAESCPTS